MKTSLYSLAQTEFKIHLFVFKCIMLSEINLTQKNTFWMLPFMCPSRASKTNLWRKQVRNCCFWAVGRARGWLGRDTWEILGGLEFAVKVEQLRFVCFDVNKLVTVSEKDMEKNEWQAREEWSEKKMIQSVGNCSSWVTGVYYTILFSLYLFQIVHYTKFYFLSVLKREHTRSSLLIPPSQKSASLLSPGEKLSSLGPGVGPSRPGHVLSGLACFPTVFGGHEFWTLAPSLCHLPPSLSFCPLSFYCPYDPGIGLPLLWDFDHPTPPMSSSLSLTPGGLWDDKSFSPVSESTKDEFTWVQFPF